MKKQKDKEKSKLKIPKTVQQSIPYESIFPNDIIEVKPGYFSKSYYFGDANFRTETEEKQDDLFQEYGNLLNRFNSETILQIVIFNRSTDINEIRNAIFLKPGNDNLYKYRDEYNNILLDKMNEGRNDIKRERYLTITIHSKDIVSATSTFVNMDIDVDEAMKKINKTGVRPLTITERLAILYDIYNPNSKVTFDKKIASICDEEGNIVFKKLFKAGLTTKDLIGCDSITVNSKYVQLGDAYARSFFLDNLPTFMNTDILSELTSLPCNMLTSVIYRTTPQKKATRMVRGQITNINADLIKLQKNASQAGYSTELVSPEITRSKDEADELLKDVMSRNQKIFYVSVMITILANSMEELNSLSESLQSKAADFLCQAKKLDAQQLAGINSCLPLANLNIDIDRVLTTESAAVFFPFSMNEIMDKGGISYGLNAVSKNMIIHNRATSPLPNGIILGQSGSGKSFIAKNEIIPMFLGTNDDIIIVDPEQEYMPIAEEFGGQVIHISPGTNTFVNPLDMDIQYADKEDPVAMKCDFLTTICETIVGKNIGLSPYDVNIIHRCGKKIYLPYMEHMETLKSKGISCDRTAAPTLIDFYDELMKQPESDAKRLALSLEQYCIGNYDIFAHRTNVDLKSRLIVYDIKNTGTGSKELAMQICLNDIWNRIIENRRLGKTTWVYLDEFYLLTQTESSAAFLQQIYKRARKWSGIITGITQDVEDLLVSPEARGILNNCGFILIMNQSPLGRSELQQMYSISPNLLGYITDRPPGTGLMYNGITMVPFINKFPVDTALYKLMSTKPNEDQ